jgi:hypothetical protein
MPTPRSRPIVNFVAETTIKVYSPIEGEGEVFKEVFVEEIAELTINSTAISQFITDTINAAISDLNLTEGDSPELRVFNSRIQWKLTQDVDWNTLILLSDLTGDNITLRNQSGFIQWKPENSGTWTNLVAIEDITGEDGRNAYELDVITNGFNGTLEDWLEYIKGEDGITVSVNEITQVSGNITLTTDDIPEGTTNQYFTNERAVEAAFPNGSSFPLDPLPYQRFFNTTKNMEFYWDDVKEAWLSVQTFTDVSSLSGNNIAADTLGRNNGTTGFPITQDIYIVRFELSSTTSPSPSGTAKIVRFTGSATDLYTLNLTNEQFKAEDNIDIDFEGGALLRIVIDFTGDTINQPTAIVYYKFIG